MNNPLSATTHALEDYADRAASQADQALSATQRAATHALNGLQDSVNDLRNEVPGALQRAAAQVDELTRRGVERARQASADLRQQASRAGDSTASYIKDEPVKAVLMAAAAGAAIALLIGLAARSR